MSKIKIGIIREDKVPQDKRVPFIPVCAKAIMKQFSNTEVCVQTSDIRCFPDKEYEEFGLPLVDSVENCDILFGVKEVPISELIDNKTYFFFSHTIKEQPYNRDLLRSVLEKRITLIDYETLTDDDGSRIVAFGRYAGLVGAYNGIRTYGLRYNLFDLRPAHNCFDLDDLKTEFKKVHLPKIKIAVTGGGRVSKGVMEILHGLDIRKVTPAEYLNERFEEPVFTQLNSRDYTTNKSGKAFKRNEFYSSPEKFEGDFLKYARKTDLLIAGAFWNPAAPVLFQREDMVEPDFRIKIIADITCDIEGSIPSTKRSSTIDDPVYDYNPTDDKIEAAFRDEGNVTVMAVDNLPCELPRNASTDFGQDLLDKVLPHLLNGDDDGVVERATIAKDGMLTKPYQYLQSYVNG